MVLLCVFLVYVTQHHVPKVHPRGGTCHNSRFKAVGTPFCSPVHPSTGHVLPYFIIVNVLLRTRCADASQDPVFGLFEPLASRGMAVRHGRFCFYFFLRACHLHPFACHQRGRSPSSPCPHQPVCCAFSSFFTVFCLFVLGFLFFLFCFWTVAILLGES